MARSKHSKYICKLNACLCWSRLESSWSLNPSPGPHARFESFFVKCYVTTSQWTMYMYVYIYRYFYVYMLHTMYICMSYIINTKFYLSIYLYIYIDSQSRIQTAANTYTCDGILCTEQEKHWRWEPLYTYSRHSCRQELRTKPHLPQLSETLAQSCEPLTGTLRVPFKVPLQAL